MDELADYLTTLGPDRPAVIGHSVGGLAAMMLATRYPDRVARIVVVDAFPYAGLMFRPDATVATLRPQAEALREYLRAADPADATPEHFIRMARTAAAREKIARWTAAGDPRVSSTVMFDALTTDLRDELDQIRVPVRVLYPFDGPPEAAEGNDHQYQRAYGPHADGWLQRIDNSRHFIMLDGPRVRFAPPSPSSCPKRPISSVPREPRASDSRLRAPLDKSICRRRRRTPPHPQPFAAGR